MSGPVPVSPSSNLDSEQISSGTFSNGQVPFVHQRTHAAGTGEDVTEDVVSPPIVQTTSEQYSAICERPKLSRALHAGAFVLEIHIVAIIYIWGWKVAGASWLLVSPACVYLGLICTALTLSQILGPIRFASFFNKCPPFHLLAIATAGHFTLAPLFLPASQKPFKSTIACLAGNSVGAFCGNTIGLIFGETGDAHILLSPYRDFLWRGVLRSFRFLDAWSDFEVGYKIVHRVTEGRCSWVDGSSQCKTVESLGFIMLFFAAVEYLLAMILTFGSKAMDDRSSPRLKSEHYWGQSALLQLSQGRQ